MMERLWMCPPEIPEDPYIAVYRCRFASDGQCEIPFSFSADERVQFFLDGRRVADGPERGAPERWYFQRTCLSVSPGAHVLTARVLAFGFHQWAYGQLSVRHGLWIDEPRGILDGWECQIESGCSFEAGFPDWGTFPRVHLDRSHNAGILRGIGGVWRPVSFFRDRRELFPPDLPPMRYDRLFPVPGIGGSYRFPEYVCAWGEYHFSGRGTVRIRWAETPYLSPDLDPETLTGDKGCRNGKFFIGNFDTFEIDGELHWFDYWWHAGHYCQILTDGDVVCRAEFHRTGYPYEKFNARGDLEKMAFETLQACSWETYMDCPYYEQLMYIGDSRLEAICTRLVTSDDRLIRKSLRMLSLSQRPDGSLNSQYPSRSFQTIPSFMLIWLLMLHDHYEVNGRDGLIRELMPAAGRLLGFFRAQERDGLLSIDGWNFIDWCDDERWVRGTPPGGRVNSILNLFYVLALQAAADMTGETEYLEKARRAMRLIREKFFDREKGLYAIDPERRFFSEHSQVLAMLTGPDARLAENLRLYDGKLTPCSIYFSFYYLQACAKYGLHDLADKRLERWKALKKEGLTTFPEEFGNPRSDCHAWSSHILCYLRTAIPGNRPDMKSAGREREKEILRA